MYQTNTHVLDKSYCQNDDICFPSAIISQSPCPIDIIYKDITYLIILNVPIFRLILQIIKSSCYDCLNTCEAAYSLVNKVILPVLDIPGILLCGHMHETLEQPDPLLSECHSSFHAGIKHQWNIFQLCHLQNKFSFSPGTL